MIDRIALRRYIAHWRGRLYTHMPALARRWSRRFAALANDGIPFTPLRKPLRACRIALLTTGGVHLREQPGFNMADPRGDASFRAIPAATPPAQLTITHDYYDHRDAERDLNILLPLGLLRELTGQGHVGALGTCYSFMGHIEPPHLEVLLHRTAPQVAGLLKRERIDAALLTPA